MRGNVECPIFGFRGGFNQRLLYSALKVKTWIHCSQKRHDQLFWYGHHSISFCVSIKCRSKKTRNGGILVKIRSKPPSSEIIFLDCSFIFESIRIDLIWFDCFKSILSHMWFVVLGIRLPRSNQRQKLSYWMSWTFNIWNKIRIPAKWVIGCYIHPLYRNNIIIRGGDLKSLSREKSFILYVHAIVWIF